MITVRIAKVPQLPQSFQVDGESPTVRDALRVANLSGDGCTINKNQESATLDSPIADGDLIWLHAPVKGN